MFHNLIKRKRFKILIMIPGNRTFIRISVIWEVGPAIQV